ncbi:response regulator transcription factor [Cohnella fermenti]|uniref:response regulator transcription factor n=1 Tax=Cohnella fermenti TaxID=2565925 RepID=UPI001454D52F|nr:response regulator transcription factor [Cohnella fermenti]
MRKILLVDDEMFARKGLIGLIPWEQFGFEVAGEAEDGEEALALIEQVKPDVVITDIRMPVLDGLELIQEVRSRGGHAVRFIIISGYGDFKYAQQAVRFGVQDYLLKPIEESELTAALMQIREQLDKEQPHSEASSALVQASLFEKLLSGRADGPLVAAASTSFGLKEETALRHFAVELNDLPAASPEAERIERTERAKTAVARAAERLGFRTAPYVHLRSEFELGFLLPAKTDPREARTIGDEMARACSKAAGCTAKVYIGEAVPGLAQARRSYLSGLEAMKHKYALDEKNVIVGDELTASALHYREIDSSVYAELMDRLEENDMTAVRDAADKLFAAFREQVFAYDSVAAAMSRCVHGATRIIQTMEGDPASLASLTPMLEWAAAPKTLRGLQTTLLIFLTECAGYICELRGKVSKGDIAKIKAYIDHHYNENISLKSIAARYYMNPVYLGQLFKKTYGSYFNDYLLQLRIREAKRQLRQTDKKVYEIAASVGFNNADYFVTQFEKVERKTPTEYKNALLEKI